MQGYCLQKYNTYIYIYVNIYVCVHAHTYTERKKELLIVFISIKTEGLLNKFHELASIRYKYEKADMGFKSSPKVLKKVWLWSSAGWRSTLCKYDYCAELEDQG